MGAAKRIWMEAGEPPHFTMEKIEIERTPIVEAWAFKGQVYAKAFISVGGNLRRLNMYRLIHRPLNEAAAEVLAANVLSAGSVDLFLWDEVKTMWEGEGGDRKPSRDELIAEGKRTGVCQVCHRKLTNPKSVAAGIGPICAGRV
jgi:hypothetical protein